MRNKCEFPVDTILLVEEIFQDAARIERMIPLRERAMLDCKSAWPDYLYDQDDKKDQEPTTIRSRPTARQIDLLEKAIKMLNLLGMRKDRRTVMGKKIIWARANGFSYREIAFIAGVPPKTCENWYKRGIAIIAKRMG